MTCLPLTKLPFEPKTPYPIIILCGHARNNGTSCGDYVHVDPLADIACRWARNAPGVRPVVALNCRLKALWS